MSKVDRRTALYSSYGHAAHIAEGVSPDRLAGPTCCPDYDVAGMVDHLVGAANRAAALGRGEPPTGAEFPHVELADAPELLRQAGKEAEAAWSEDARLTATTTMPWGETYDGFFLVDMFLCELATHAWDLAAATGQLDRLNPTLAVTALAGARSILKPEYRDMVGPGSPFGQEVEAPADADDWEKLAAFTGRQPRP